MTLKLHHLRPAPGAKTAKTRVGRGEGSKGKTAGRGTKGTKARYQVPSMFESGNVPRHIRLARLYPEGGEVTVESLVAHGAVRDGHPVKVLGEGELSVGVQVTAQAFSAAARTKIEAAGGSATVA